MLTMLIYHRLQEKILYIYSLFFYGNETNAELLLINDAIA